MNLLTSDPTTGAADGPSDYHALSSGWALGTAAAVGWDMGGGASIARGVEQHEQRFGQSTRAGTYMFKPGTETPELEPDAANDKYGISGQLSWDKPVREGEAQLLNQWKTEELHRNDLLDRSTPGAAPAVARFLAGMGASLIDPVNIAASFIPVLGEARWAQLAGRIGPWSARFARGAAEGFVGSAAVEPITALQQVNQQGEYGLDTAILDIGFGTIGGAGLHMLGGAFHSVAERWRGAPMEARAAAFTHSIDALTEGRPVRAAEIVEPARIEATLSRTEALAEAPAVASAAGAPAVATGPSAPGLATAPAAVGATVPEGVAAKAITPQPAAPARGKPQDALAFVRAQGGIRDDEGHALAELFSSRGVVRKTGLGVDDVGEALHEAGYFGDPKSTPRPTEAQVIDLLHSAASKPVYSIFDTAHALDRMALRPDQARDLAGNEVGRVAEENRLSVSPAEHEAAIDLMTKGGMSASDALDHVLERSAMADPMALIRRDATGEGGASDDAVAAESSRRADTSNAASVPPQRMPAEAVTRAAEAEAEYRALVKEAAGRGEEIDTTETDAVLQQMERFPALKKAASLLADCMVSHGV